MKKILFTLMLLLCATAGWALPDQDEQGYYLVYDLQDLKDAVNATKDSQGKSTSKIKLMNNIYLNGMAGTLCTTFAGEIDGKYTLKNNKGEDVGLKYAFFSSTFGDEETRKKCSYLFSSLNGATIKNVAFYNIRVESSDRDNIGVIASMATNTTFEQVTLEKCSIFSNHNNAGALAGQAKDCKFHAVFVNNCSVTVDGVRAGGFVGNSENNQYYLGGSGLGTGVFADGNNATNAGWSGGITGYSKKDLFYFMANLALVGADQNFVGGYAGESEGSSFIRCQNSGAVLQINEEDSKPEKSFRDQHDKMLKYISEHNSEWTIDAGLDKDTKLLACMLNVAGDLDVKDILDLPTQPVTRGGAFPWIGTKIWYVMEGDYMWFHPATPFHIGQQMATEGWTAETVFTGVSGEAGAAAGTGTGMSIGTICAIGATVAAIVIATAITIYIFNGDDEVGGICGKATGGLFEQCTNSATLSCRDDNCGGIVGLGIGVTINNCLNTGEIIWDEKVCSGSILGQAKANGSKKCKVTNCFSSEALQIIGTWYIDDGVDPASGNNYRPLLQDKDVCDWEYAIPNFGFFNKRLVGYWLNNGFENRRANAAPWRFTVNSTDQYPLLDPTHDEITVESLNPDHISTADQLLAFAEKVYKYNQFACAVLDDDIVMPENSVWSPIGSSDSKFRGVFDGQGHTISGLYQYCVSEGVGLFGTVHAGAVIRNVTVKDSQITNLGEGGTAGIVGCVGIEGWRWGNVIIENCASYADVYAGRHGGGILGLVNTKTENDPGVHVIVENCYNGGTITTLLGNSGLLCGWTKHNGHIRNCWSAGELRHEVRDGKGTCCPFSTKTSNNEEPEYFAGYDSKIDIKNCYILDAKNIIDDYAEGKMQDSVTNIKDAELARGVLTWKLNGKTNDVSKSLTWQQELGKDAYPVPGNKGLYHTREIQKDKYGTICLPYPIKSDEHISYYTFVSDEIGDGTLKLNFEYADSVPAAVPALFFSAEEQTYYFPGAGDDLINENANCTTYSQTPDSEWLFVGYLSQEVVIDDAEQAKSFYYLSDGTIRNAKKLTVSPYRAFFHGPSIDKLRESLGNPSAARISIVIDGEEDETSALELVYDYEHHNENDNRSYTLFGTEAGEGYRGIVIRGGKKVIVNN